MPVAPQDSLKKALEINDMGAAYRYVRTSKSCVEARYKNAVESVEAATSLMGSWDAGGVVLLLAKVADNLEALVSAETEFKEVLSIVDDYQITPCKQWTTEELIEFSREFKEDTNKLVRQLHVSCHFEHFELGVAKHRLVLQLNVHGEKMKGKADETHAQLRRIDNAVLAKLPKEIDSSKYLLASSQEETQDSSKGPLAGSQEEPQNQ